MTGWLEDALLLLLRRLRELRRLDRVAIGQTMIVLESMKMELRVTAPLAATIEAPHCALGEMVERGAMLAAVVADPANPGVSA